MRAARIWKPFEVWLAAGSGEGWLRRGGGGWGPGVLEVARGFRVASRCTRPRVVDYVSGGYGGWNRKNHGLSGKQDVVFVLVRARLEPGYYIWAPD